MAVNYLRVSVTDRCNLRCIYCMPREGISKVVSDDILSFEEIEHFVRLSVDWGIDKIRITGGEPLIRKDVIRLIRSLSKIKGIKDISMTTNGLLLSRYAEELKNAGLKRINISLDTLKEDRFIKITRFQGLDNVLEGIRKAKAAGLSPIKINMVVIKGINDDEVIDFAELALKETLVVRFIECLPILNNYEFVPNHKIKQVIEKKFGRLKVRRGLFGSNHGPAENFQMMNSSGVIGFISPLSQPFCNGCNRLRLTSRGLLKSCLFSDFVVDLKKALAEKRDEEIKTLFELAVKNKPKQRNLNLDTCHMFKIGG